LSASHYIVSGIGNSKFSSLFEESLTVAIPPPKYSDRGFTLVEMLVVLLVAGIIAGFAVPSLLSLNKPLRDGTLLLKNQLSLVRSKAISSNQSYRILPNPVANPDGTRSFVVEYAANCRVTATGTNGWQRASQLDLDLPKNVGITDIATNISDPAIGVVSNALGNGVCFDNRGIVDAPISPIRLILKDFRGDNRAKIALIEVGRLGSVDIYTYDSNTSTNPNRIPPNSDNNPVF
jgi:prepilin-type N-terminal cleavage/methylation domain-containing protein